jgi:hypothetical protein
MTLAPKWSFARYLLELRPWPLSLSPFVITATLAIRSQPSVGSKISPAPNLEIGDVVTAIATLRSSNKRLWSSVETAINYELQTSIRKSWH